MMLTCSAYQTLPILQTCLPLEALCGGEVRCVGRGSEERFVGGAASSRVVLADWDLSVDAARHSGADMHLVALDPPYRREHIGSLRAAAEGGAVIHLYYGADERQTTARLLRYLVHPRFAMVCVFRAMQQGEYDIYEVFASAARLAWQEAQIVLCHEELSRAATVLEELGGARLVSGEAKLDARYSPTYVAAAADYEECAKLCLTL